MCWWLVYYLKTSDCSPVTWMITFSSFIGGEAEGLRASPWPAPILAVLKVHTHAPKCTCTYSSGERTNYTSKYSLRWKESHKAGNGKVGAACPAGQAGGLMGWRRMEPECNHTGLTGWLHPSLVTALKLLDGYYFHYYYFNAPLRTHRSVL